MASTTGLGYSSRGSGNGYITSFVDKGTVESLRYYLARRTVMEMLRDRDCIIADSEINRSLSQFGSEFGNKPELERLRICAPFRLNPSKKILVIFCGTIDITKKVVISILLQIVNKESLHRIILILQSKINSYAQKVIDEFPVKVETFQITELLVNITKHVLEPKYEIMTSEEKKKLLKKYSVEDKQIPCMLEADSIARYYGLEKKQMLKVTYKGALTDSLVNYRCVM